jgi:ferredoxin
MGVFQDIISWMSKKTARKKKKYTYSKPKTILRWSIVGVTTVLFFSGITLLLGLLDPFSAYGRMATHLFKPAYMAGNNLLASIFTNFDNYRFYFMDIFIFSVFSLVVAIITFLVIGFFAWKYGRTFCNTICPVGTLLGVPGKYSFFKIKIDSGKCTGCGICAAECKASCIDAKGKTVDNNRCVDCFNCVDSCKFNALSYTSRKETVEKTVITTVDEGKRKFLLAGITTAIATPALLANEKINLLTSLHHHRHGRGKEKVNLLTGGISYIRQTPISPPGALSTRHLSKHCSSCHLCISKCPTNVLKPAFMEYGIGGMMQPVMFFEKGFCNFDCTICSNVCPNHALKPLTKEEKHKTQVGYVVFNKDICIVPTKHKSCGACAEHCPTQAVRMIPYKGGLTIPTINTDICVGCGACEFICPTRPYKAIYVEGNEVHQEAKPFVTEKKEDIKINDFGF